MAPERSYLIRIIGVPPPRRVLVDDQLLDQVVRPESVIPGKFLFWAIHRDPDQGWFDTNPGLERDGWFYDYERLALVIRTEQLSRDQLHSIVASCDSPSVEGLYRSLELLHSGWVGMYRAVNRVMFYWTEDVGALFADCLDLPYRLQHAASSAWADEFSRFSDSYQQLLSDLREYQFVNQQLSAWKQSFIAHLADRIV
jgi:hypothetical protein